MTADDAGALHVRTAGSTGPVIQTQSFCFSYPGADRPAVRDVAFAVERGEIFGFLGPSGAGKSTTQNVLIRLLDGYEGTITVLGRDLRAWDRDYYRRIGVAFEAPNHYLKLTAHENLRFFAGLHGGQTEDPRALLDRVGLAEDGDKRVGEFSKGMRGRLTLARALLHRPELLFLDEPTAGLDPVTARRIRQVIREARDAGATIFLTTHDMATADELCDRVAFLVDGGIAALDAPRALRLAHGRRVVRVEAMRDGTRAVREFALDGLADDPDFQTLLRSGRCRDDSHVGNDARRRVRSRDGAEARMIAFVTALRWDIVLQARNGFYWASAFVVLVVGGLLLSVPESVRADGAAWVPALLAVNLQITTFFFVAGLMLLERDEGTLTALAVSPFSPAAYLATRMITLTALAAVETVAVVLIAFGTRRVVAAHSLRDRGARRDLHRLWRGSGGALCVGQ